MNVDEAIQMMKDGHIILVEKFSQPWLLRWEPYDEEFECGNYPQSSSLGDAPMDTCFRHEYCEDLRRMLGGKVEVFKEDEWSMNGNDEIVSGAEAIIKLLEGKTLRCVTKENFGSGVLMSGRVYKIENGKVRSRLGNSDWLDSHASLNNLLKKEFVVME